MSFRIAAIGCNASRIVAKSPISELFTLNRHFNLLVSIQTRQTSTNNYNNNNLLMKPITVRTCVGTWDRLKEINPKLYRNAPSEGIDVTVDYIDTLDPTWNQVKTIVALHGSPGNNTNFDPIPQYFANKNVRVIVPNMPSFADTRRTKAFWHSGEEKGQFLKDFLRKLNVDKVDCLISHSLGIHTVSQFWDQCEEFEIKSFALFSPQPLWQFTSKQIRITEKLFWSQSDWWFNLLDRLKLHQRGLVPMRMDNIDDLLATTVAVLDRKSPAELPKRLEKLARSDKPIILLYGQKEKLIFPQYIKKFHEYLGITEEEIVRIDTEKQTPEESIQMDRRVIYYNMKNGGHFAHANFHPFTVKMVENLLNYRPR